MSGLITVKIDYSKEIDHVRTDIDSKEIDHVWTDIDSKEIDHVRIDYSKD